MKKIYFTLIALPCALIVALMLAGCGGNTNNPYSPILTGGNGNGGGNNPPDFTLSISPTTTQTIDEAALNVVKRPGTIQPGLPKATYTITATATNGFTGTIQLSHAPVNSNTDTGDMEFSLQPPSLTLSTSAQSQTATYVIAVDDPAEPTGEADFKVTATSGSITHSVVAHLNIINTSQTTRAR